MVCCDTIVEQLLENRMIVLIKFVHFFANSLYKAVIIKLHDSSLIIEILILQQTTTLVLQLL